MTTPTDWKFGPDDCIAILRSNGVPDIFTDYESYTITSDLLEPSDSFEFRKPAPSAKNGTRDTISHRSVTLAMPIYLMIQTKNGQAQQLRGRIYRSSTESSQSDGTIFNVVGYDHMRPLVDSDVLPGLVFNNCSFKDVILKVLAPFGFTESDLLIDNEANRNFLLGRGTTVKKVRDASRAEDALLAGDNIGALDRARQDAIKIANGMTTGDSDTVLKSLQEQARLRAFGGGLVSAAAYGPLQITKPTTSLAVDGPTGTVTVIDPAIYTRDAASGALIPASSAGLDVPQGTVFLAAEPARYTTVSALATINVKKAKPHAGESVYAFLHRHAIRYNLLIWGTADGKIVFGRPNYAQDPIFSFVCQQGDAAYGNTCESISRVENIEHRPSEIHVYGRSVGGDFSRSAIHSVVYDPFIQSMGLFRPITIHDNSCLTKADADQRANYELCIRRQTSDVIRVTVKGHAQAGNVFAIDTVANVVWPAGEIDGPMYIIRRTFTRSKTSGTHTNLELVPLNSIVLGPPTDASVNDD